MNTHPTVSNRQSVKPLPDAKPVDSLKREIWLDAFRAATWIVYMEELLAAGEPRTAVRQFHEELSDACWLARWKREYVVIEVEICALPELVSQLIPGNSQTVTTSFLEDMLAALSGDVTRQMIETTPV